MARSLRRRAVRFGSPPGQEKGGRLPLIRLLAVLVVCLILPAVAIAQEDGVTAWGAPDLSGHWIHRSLTPLERPEALAEKTVLTEEEAAAFIREQQALRHR